MRVLKVGEGRIHASEDPHRLWIHVVLQDTDVYDKAPNYPWLRVLITSEIPPGDYEVYACVEYTEFVSRGDGLEERAFDERILTASFSSEDP